MKDAKDETKNDIQSEDKSVKVDSTDKSFAPVNLANENNLKENNKENNNVDEKKSETTPEINDKTINLSKNYNNDKKIEEFSKKVEQTLKDKSKRHKNFTSGDLEELDDKLDKKENGFFEKLITKRFVKNVSRDIIIKKLVTISLVLILLIVGILYALSYTYANAAGYGVSIIADNSNTRMISLCDNSQFSPLSLGLKATGIESMDNITYDWIPKKLDDSTGGSNNGENYICYTFYVLNSGSESLNYLSELYIRSSTRQVETAVRIEIFRNTLPTIYTYSFEDEIDGVFLNDEKIDVEEFYSPTIISNENYDLNAGSYDKFTIIIWLEGQDKDCVNDRHSGKMEVAWKFTVVLSGNA